MDDSTVKFSSRWLLNQLIVHLTGHIEYKCEHRKIGTVLYRKGGNLLASVSWALGRVPLSDPTESSTTLSSQTEKLISEAGDVINNLLHDELRKPMVDSPCNPKALNIDTALENTNPLLLDFFHSITRTAREWHHHHLDTESHASKHTKKFDSILFCLF